MNTGGQQAAGYIGAGSGSGRFGDDKDPDLGANTRFKPGESGNPKGRPKGVKNLSTVIQEMLNDEAFIERLSSRIKDDAKLPDPDFQGTPMKAIISTAIVEAMSTTTPPPARQAARDYLAKYGYGTKVDVTSNGDHINPYSELTVEELRRLAGSK